MIDRTTLFWNVCAAVWVICAAVFHALCDRWVGEDSGVWAPGVGLLGGPLALLYLTTYRLLTRGGEAGDE